MYLASNRLLRIDLHNPQDVDDVDLPKKANEIGTIRNTFLDPTASHLLITTTHVVIESVAWSPAQPTTSTREILLETQDETASEEFMRKDEEIYETGLITGVYVDALPGQMDLRRVAVTTATKIILFVGKISRHGHDIAPIITKFYDSEPKDDYCGERYHAWLSSTGVYHGSLYTAPATSDLGTRVFAGSKLLKKSALPLDDSLVFQEDVSDIILKILGFVWTQVNRDVWRLKMADKSFDEAYRYTETPHQKDTVAVAQGDYLAAKGLESFEEVCLTFLDNNEPDALRKYLLAKLASPKRSQIMQRIMNGSWLIEQRLSLLRLGRNIRNLSRNTRGTWTMTPFMRLFLVMAGAKKLPYYETIINDYQLCPSTYIGYNEKRAAMDTVNILMRQCNLSPRHLIPAMLNYNEDTMVPLSQVCEPSSIIFTVTNCSRTKLQRRPPRTLEMAFLPSIQDTPLLSPVNDATIAIHAFHSDCLTTQILKQAGAGNKKRIHTLQNEISKGWLWGRRGRGREFAVEAIDQPLIGPEDDKDEWAL
ncbi:hypothetical protein L211DRAFT_860847 [Terfezia boudieri ATCC MYA-4762]|uniref:Uncharacterized protein n=1 Tax=Terfezia boudieri ATCC MYA-4762 TaxID=1051890 RepID=A0A3N4LV71_9PEZI|nr:hypothetical protein L211DRAFT_860847 [Terfezia boudieri ATCC MYA-4762]